jgi:hypothetical protein
MLTPEDINDKKFAPAHLRSGAAVGALESQRAELADRSAGLQAQNAVAVKLSDALAKVSA